MEQIESRPSSHSYKYARRSFGRAEVPIYNNNIHIHCHMYIYNTQYTCIIIKEIIIIAVDDIHLDCKELQLVCSNGI